MLEIQNLVKKYGKFTAVDGLSLTVNDGEIFGFVGPNGAGKTTTMKIMAGLLSSTSGNVLINGVDVTAHPRKLREKIGYMPDFFGVYDNLKVDEYMDFYAGTYHIPYSERETIINNLLELVDLSHKKDAYVDTLSRGMKQRLCLARSLIHDPDILILDEPASGLDPRARVEMKEVLKQLKTLGKTIIISSHILPELAELCTVIGIIDKGKIAAYGTVAQIMQQLIQKRIIKIKVMGNMDQLITILKEQPNVHEIIEKVDEVEIEYDGDDHSLAYLLKNMVQQDIPIISFSEKEGNLEEIFMQITEGGESDHD
ncbi:MAG: type transport system ATP-binding protein [Epulopiscium sp.]|jgi:ABC-2 type transport system ATP-binding protein|nr:ybhF 1 [Defluviitaleaceae bacterium]MDK2787304.1 type transport system ATP-binding protein [Candidatus Epulonipiscium sp.]HHW68081.1 ABC transporter ATP-binding protein [Candidatus Epulonipiscium sp.]